jgi:ubiquinone/menaquinone biosynthesis C-methylase UbiE
MKNKLNYGIDGINVIRWMMMVSIIASILYVNKTLFTSRIFQFTPTSFLWIAITFYFQILLFILYAKFGKFRQRDRILNSYNWKGNEKVLDVGCGLGLLLIGAAKKLTSGKAVGIDIWSVADLSSNNLQNAMNNAKLEGVADKVEIMNQNIIKTVFDDNSFDVIVSNLCLHNIYNKRERETACKEIARILKTGGTVILSDYKNNRQYANVLMEVGLTQKTKNTYYFDVYPPLTIQKFIK